MVIIRDIILNSLTSFIISFTKDIHPLRLISLIALTLTSNPLLFASECKDLFHQSRTVTGYFSTTEEANQLAQSMPVVPFKQQVEWIRSDFNGHLNSIVNLSLKDTTESLPQVISTSSAFPQSIINLIEKLFKKTVSEKSLRKATHSYYQFLVSNFHNFTIQNPVLAEKFTSPEDFARALSSTIENVEVSLVIIKLKNTNYFQHFFTTSNSTFGINIEHLLPGLQSVLKKQLITPEQIDKILLFHNHSDIQPLSATDFSGLFKLRKQLREFKIYTPLETYAVSKGIEVPFIFFGIGAQ